MPFDPDQKTHLAAAQSFVELGVYLDADAALDDIAPFCRHLPEVLTVRLEIHRALERWELMRAVAKRMVVYDPEYPQWRVTWADAAPC